MKIIISLIIFCSLISCQNTSDSTQYNSQNTTNSLLIQNGDWLKDFKKFRDAVYHNRIEEVKTYFDFPIRNCPEIWSIAFEKGPFEVEYETTLQDFTEKDFDKAFNSIFSKPFIQSILKIKSDSLLIKKHFETIKISESDSLSYNMTATLDLENNELQLSLNNRTAFKTDENGTEYLESNYIFYFKILNNQKIKFTKILIAG